jgi:LysM repeat protein
LPAALAGSIALTMTGPVAAQAAPARTQPATHTEPVQVPGALGRAPLVSRATTYTVRSGDTVTAIAIRHGLRTSDVLAWNGLHYSSVIYPGQVLRLTRPGTAAAKPQPAAKPKPTTSRSTYTVRAGDTVSRIAAAHRVTIADIVTANRLRNASIIYVGQRLVIQRGAAGSAPATGAHPASTGSKPVPVANTTASRYVVRAGDTISDIAGRFHVSTQSVLSANGLAWSSIIYPGQSLKIPVRVIAGLTAEQSANVRTIVGVGRSLGVSNRGIEIALGTAMTESGLRNLNYGDRDSLGLFQQRPSTGWGTKAQILDPVSSTRAFFLGRGNATRGLLDIRGWQTMAYTKAAQAVQVSAFPNAYAVWEKPSARWLAAS